MNDSSNINHSLPQGNPDEVRVSQRGDRKINQDRCEIFKHGSIKVMILADGMGGHPKGEVAAQILVDTCYHKLNETDELTFEAESFITEVITTAHKKILAFGLKKRPPIYPRTTAVIVVIQRDVMHWSHLGDSRTYLFRHGRAHMRTMDHTQAEKMRLKGALEDSDSQSTASGRSGVSRCLGGMKKIKNVEVTPAYQLQDGDILMLCTDGVWSQLKEAELEAIMINESQTLQERLFTLVNQAVESKHPNSDNATAVALCWHADKDSKPLKSTTTESAEPVDNALDHLKGLIDKYS